MKKTLTAASLSGAILIGLAGPVTANEPIDPVPVNTSLYELDFEPYQGSGATGKGSINVPDAGTGGPVLSVEIDRLSPNTKYKVRFAGPEDGNTNPTKCSFGPANLGPLKGDNGEFQIAGASLDTGPEGVLRWEYDKMTPFTGDRVAEINNGEPAIVVAEINADNTEGDIVACAALGGVNNAVSNPIDQAFPIALVGGQTPQSINGSDVTARGQVNLIGSLLTYDFTLTGEELIDAGDGLQNHIVLLRSTGSCDGTTANALKQTVASLTNFQRSSAAPRSTAELLEVFPRSPINFTGKSLSVRGSVVLPGVDRNAIGNYGIVVLGLESGATNRPNGGLQTREMTPTACLNLVDKASEVGPDEPVMVADATTLDELVNATDFRRNDANTGTDQEIARLYTAFFNRDPDVGGLKYWISVSKGEIDGKTYSTRQVSEFFVPSEEFKNSFVKVEPEDFVQRVYSNVLSRAGEASGVAYWNDVLSGTDLSGNNPTLGKVANRGELVYYVAINPEFVNRKPYGPS